jgi:hypothetical protein
MKEGGGAGGGGGGWGNVDTILTNATKSKL